MNRYTIEQQAAISDIIFNYPDTTEVVQGLLGLLGFELTIEEIQQEHKSRI